MESKNNIIGADPDLTNGELYKRAKAKECEPKLVSNEKPTIYNTLEMAYDYELTMMIDLNTFMHTETYEKMDELDRYLVQTEFTARDKLVTFLEFRLDKAKIKHKIYDPYFSEFQNKLHEHLEEGDNK